jgi:hypothetical protein
MEEEDFDKVIVDALEEDGILFIHGSLTLKLNCISMVDAVIAMLSYLGVSYV